MPYRRENLTVEPLQWATSGDPIFCTEEEAELFTIYDHRSASPVEFFDTRQDAEEYLDAIEEESN